jgi:protein-tyrosine kinase
VFASAWPMVEGQSNKTETVSARPGSLGCHETSLFAQQSTVRGFTLEWQERLASGPKGNPVLVEQFRRLAATLYHTQKTQKLCTVMVTSAAPADGKTLTAVNLALVLSESYGRRVLLMDADLRRPSIANLVHLGGGVGLSEALRSDAEAKLATVALSPTLTLLPAGQAMPDPIGGLTSPRMRRILAEAASHFDWVILDAPPAGPLADASLLAGMVDATLFVVRAGHTEYEHIQKAIESIGRERILGVVLNDLGRMPVEPYQHYYATVTAESKESTE